MMFPKTTVYRSEKWKQAVRELGFCVRCRTQGPTECAHRDESKGMGQKTSDVTCASLCAPCHRELTDSRHLEREEKRNEMNRCIVLTIEELASTGRLTIK
jgi:hypothetical protein